MDEHEVIAPPVAVPAPKETIEKLREKHKPVGWAHAAARAYYGWPIGMELTEADYKIAIESMFKLPIR